MAKQTPIMNAKPPTAWAVDTSSCFSTQLEKSEIPSPSSCCSGSGAVGGSWTVSMLDSARTARDQRGDAHAEARRICADARSSGRDISNVRARAGAAGAGADGANVIYSSVRATGSMNYEHVDM